MRTELGTVILLLVAGVLVASHQSTTENIGEGWDSVKMFFKDLNLDIQERFSQFGEWIKGTYQSGKDTSKNHLDHVKGMAQQFASSTKETSKEVAEEAREFFRPYKDELGELWGKVETKTQNIINRQ